MTWYGKMVRAGKSGEHAKPESGKKAITEGSGKAVGAAIFNTPFGKVVLSTLATILSFIIIVIAIGVFGVFALKNPKYAGDFLRNLAAGLDGFLGGIIA